MTEFPPYPGSTASDAHDPDGPGDTYVVVVTSSRDLGLWSGKPISDPMSLTDAQDQLAQLVAGEYSDLLDDKVDLVAEVAPGHLVTYRGASMFSTSVTYDVRLARVLSQR